MKFFFFLQRVDELVLGDEIRKGSLDRENEKVIETERKVPPTNGAEGLTAASFGPAK